MESEREGFLKPFKGKVCLVDTPCGCVYGFLKGGDRSFHHGIGSLVLECFDRRWLLVRFWRCIKALEWNVLLRLMMVVLMIRALIACVKG